MRWMACFVAIMALAGCLGKLENSASETERKLDETIVGHRLTTALQILVDKDASPSLRASSAETVFILAPEERVSKYIGMPAPLKIAAFSRTVAGRTFPIANVTYVGAANDPTLGVAPANPDLYNVLSFTALSLIDQGIAKSKMPGLTAAELDDLRVKFNRMIYIATAVLGASELTQLQSVARGESTARTFMLAEAVRTAAALKMIDLVKQLGLPEDLKRDVEALSEVRMGVRAR